ncbi:hypothetical protein M9H77_29913 [Catharanthus roseus]|uniref:Uncharacterized protein n=1 Tax=Catharanthus roseus TaxID=4058 RepID=A0ACB9ZZM4_CATRO|nr:hypothetical protein M9H77_29913 [Catharanthus roseus]
MEVMMAAAKFARTWRRRLESFSSIKKIAFRVLILDKVHRLHPPPFRVVPGQILTSTPQNFQNPSLCKLIIIPQSPRGFWGIFLGSSSKIVSQRHTVSRKDVFKDFGGGFSIVADLHMMILHVSGMLISLSSIKIQALMLRLQWDIHNRIYLWDLFPQISPSLILLSQTCKLMGYKRVIFGRRNWTNAEEGRITGGLHGQSPDPQNEAIGTKFRHLVVNTSQHHTSARLQATALPYHWSKQATDSWGTYKVCPGANLIFEPLLTLH